MKEYLIVDGYNIIGAWPELAKLRDEEDMAYARDKLIEELNVHAALSGAIITVIFDAYLVKGGGGANERQCPSYLYQRGHHRRYGNRKINR